MSMYDYVYQSVCLCVSVCVCVSSLGTVWMYLQSIRLIWASSRVKPINPPSAPCDRVQSFQG